MSALENIGYMHVHVHVYEVEEYISLHFTSPKFPHYTCTHVCASFHSSLPVFVSTDQNKNLFTSPIVSFDPTTQPMRKPTPLVQGCRVSPHPPQNSVVDTIILLGPSPYQSRGFVGGNMSSSNRMIIALGDLYIINYLILKVWAFYRSIVYTCTCMYIVHVPMHVAISV